MFPLVFAEPPHDGGQHLLAGRFLYKPCKLRLQGLLGVSRTHEKRHITHRAFTIEPGVDRSGEKIAVELIGGLFTTEDQTEPFQSGAARVHDVEGQPALGDDVSADVVLPGGETFRETYERDLRCAVDIDRVAGLLGAGGVGCQYSIVAADDNVGFFLEAELHGESRSHTP